MTSMTEPQRLEGSPGRYWRRLKDGRIQCDVCPRYCKLNEGKRGLCFVRGRQDDRIVLTTYGRSSGFCVDPIEKKPLNHYLPGTPVLSFGTAGCNLTCKFCQNWDISKAREPDRLQDAASPEDIVEAEIATGSRSIAYTYNDPVIFLEYAVDVAKVARRRGIRVEGPGQGAVLVEQGAQTRSIARRPASSGLIVAARYERRLPRLRRAATAVQVPADCCAGVCLLEPVAEAGAAEGDVHAAFNALVFRRPRDQSSALEFRLRERPRLTTM